jgi:CRP-like cAMP-binding protein
MLPAIPQVVRASPFLSGIPEAALRHAIRLSVRRSFTAGGFLFHENEPAVHSFLLISGRVRVFILTQEGSRMLLRLIGPGEFLGYRAATMAPSRYGIGAEAALDSEALCWSRLNMQRLLRSEPAILFNLFSDFAERVQEYQQRLVEMATQSAPHRIAVTLLWLARKIGTEENGSIILDGNISGEDLAGMAGTRLETVSRVMGRWKRARIVQTGRHKIRISSLPKLMGLAGEP